VFLTLLTQGHPRSRASRTAGSVEAAPNESHHTLPEATRLRAVGFANLHRARDVPGRGLNEGILVSRSNVTLRHVS
jgi:hypothetical protein